MIGFIYFQASLHGQQDPDDDEYVFGVISHIFSICMYESFLVRVKKCPCLDFD